MVIPTMNVLFKIFWKCGQNSTYFEMTYQQNVAFFNL